MDYEDICEAFEEGQVHFLFGQKYANIVKPAPEGDKKTKLQKIAELPSLYHRASQTRLYRYGQLQQGKSLSEIRDEELAQKWKYGPALPPPTEDDPFSLESKEVQNDPVIIINRELRLYLHDLLARSGPRFKESEQQLVGYFTTISHDKEYPRKWAYEYNEDPTQHIAALIAHADAVLKSHAFYELDRDFVAVDFLKDQIWKMKKARELDKAGIKDDGRRKESDTSMHMAFVANRGMGKTTIAEAVAPAMYRLGLIERNTFEKTSLSSVAETTLGAVEKNVRIAFESGKGGVLLFDEADTAAGHVARGQERSAISQIINELAEKYRESTCLIVATYPEHIDTFLNSDEGLRSRFGKRIIRFPEYSTADLVKMYEKRMKEKGFVIRDDNVRSLLWDHLSGLRKNDPKSFGSGRTVRELAQETNAVLTERLDRQGFSLSGHYNKIAIPDKEKTITYQDMKIVVTGFKMNDKPEKLDVFNEVNPYKSNRAQEQPSSPKIVTLHPHLQA